MCHGQKALKHQSSHSGSFLHRCCPLSRKIVMLERKTQQQRNDKGIKMSNQGGQWNNPEGDNPQPYSNNSDPEEHQPTYPGSGYAGDPGQYQGWASPPPPPPPAYTNPYADTNPYAESSAYSGS